MKDEISKKFYEKYLKHKNYRLPDIIISGVKKCGTKGKIFHQPNLPSIYQVFLSSFGVFVGASKNHWWSQETVKVSRLELFRSFGVRNRQREHHWHSTGNFTHDLGSFLGYLHDQKSFKSSNLLVTKTGISMKLVNNLFYMYALKSLHLVEI